MLLPAELVSERLVLRRPVPEDARAVGEAVRETLDELARFFKWARLLKRWGDLDDMGARAVSGNVRFDALDNPVYFIWEDDRLVGELLIDNPYLDSDNAVELQVWLRASAHGRGLASEAARVILGHLFEVEGVDFVEARIAPENGPSRKLFNRLGFSPQGSRTDHDRYLLMASDWGRGPRALGVVVLTHPECLEHEVGCGHAERPERLTAVLDGLRGLEVTWLGAPRDAASLALAHPHRYVDVIDALSPEEGTVALDGDTDIGRKSVDAALRGVGGAVRAVELVHRGRARHAFVATRPPGHHAEPSRVRGFCLFATAAIAALHARRCGVDRVVVVDIDVHHGNGTQAVLAGEPGIRFASTHESWLFPHSVDADGADNVRNISLPFKLDGPGYRERFAAELWPWLVDFAPELVIVSAGFDGHARDEHSSTQLEAADFGWITTRLCSLAPVVSILEGGYDLEALRRSARAHVQALIESAARDAPQTNAHGLNEHALAWGEP